MSDDPDQNWQNASWQGSRLVMLRQSLKRTVRQRLQALEALCETSHTLAGLSKSTGISEEAESYSQNISPPGGKNK